MARLTKRERGSLDPDEFVFPERRAYPIENKSHARDALREGAKDATPAQDARIKRVVHRKYPDIAISGGRKHGARRR